MNDNARELQLYIDNSAQLMRSIAEPNYRNLEKRLRNGTYDPSLALKAMINVATAGAQSYVAEYCTADEKWHAMFSVADRADCAAMLLASWRAEVDCGNGWLGR